MKWKIALRKWRDKRGLIKPQTNEIVSMLQEEVNELQSAINNNDEDEIIDALSDIIVFATNHMEQMRYDLDLVMKETIKEISSRKQDIVQAKRWKNNPELKEKEKWQKDKNQDPSTLYKANYSRCRFD